jgi:hypothetical protein
MGSTITPYIFFMRNAGIVKSAGSRGLYGKPWPGFNAMDEPGLQKKGPILLL